MERIKEFFRSCFEWIRNHKKIVVAGLLVVVVAVIITACSSFGDVQNAQFGLTNNVTEVSK